MPNGFAEVDALTRLLASQGAFQRLGARKEIEQTGRVAQRALTRREEEFTRGQTRGGLLGGGLGALLGKGFVKFLLPKLLSGAGAGATGGLSLLIPSLLSAYGAYKGQEIGTKKARGKEIDFGPFLPEGDAAEIERLFQNMARESILGGSLQAGATTFGAGLRFPGLFGQTPSRAGAGVTFPGGAPQALSRRLGGLGPAPGSIEQSLAAFLGG